MKSIVADFFAGSGAFGRAAINTGRDYILCDINEECAKLMNQEPSTLDDIDEPRNKVFIMDNIVLMEALYKKHGSFIDLIYIDPPFGRNSADKQFGINWNDYPIDEELIVGLYGRLTTENMGREMMAYLSFLYPRVVLMRNLLKDTGSFYLHCDPGSSHYIKIMLDYVFG